jgi:hypothetical protein
LTKEITEAVHKANEKANSKLPTNINHQFNAKNAAIEHNQHLYNSRDETHKLSFKDKYPLIKVIESPEPNNITGCFINSKEKN